MSAPDLLALMPFARLVGLVVEGVTPDSVTGSLEWAPERCTSGGILHGGAIMTLADTLGAICAFQHLPPGAGTGTIESKTNFFRPLARGRARGTARPLHVGRSTIVVQTDVVDDDGRRIAQVTQTQAVILPR
jgi:uncharacterized protein (TIGR00369 family)